MKKELCRLNEATTDGRVILSAGTTWKNPMPLIDIDSTHIGFVTNLSLEGNRLVGELDFELDNILCLTVDMSAVNAREDEERGVLLLSGTILSARISPDTMYPWKD